MIAIILSKKEVQGTIDHKSFQELESSSCLREIGGTWLQKLPKLFQFC
jgi:hypothetical protein